MWKRILLACALVISAGCGGIRDLKTKQLESAAPSAPVRFFYETQGGKAEAFLVRPEGRGPFPLIVLLHGHSRNGSGAEVLMPVAELFAKNLCYAPLAVSLPGYGGTAVANVADREVVAHVLADGVADTEKLSWIDPKRLMLYGFSRGAVFGASSVARLPQLRALVLHSGAYDLGRLYNDTSAAWVRQVLNPSGATEPKLFNVLPEVEKWRAPTLVLHGAKDALLPVNQAEMLDQRLAAAKVPHRTVIFPDAGHRLPLDGVAKAVFSFLQQYVGSACGPTDR
jgi:dipeptidyl aminopeptidase/acylaminoacyl peptidase